MFDKQFIVIYIFLVLLSANAFTSNPDKYLTTYLKSPQVIRRHGYPAETHIIQSEDGYLIPIHRIPYGKNGQSNGQRFPLILHHGFFSSSFDWIMNGPGKSLSYKFADEGYDVWLPNLRGNVYSRGNINFTPFRPQFWNFTIHESGHYDLPAMIDYILNQTNHQQLVYIGHSLGNTIFHVMASTKPEYNKKIKAHIGLAPFSAGLHATSAFRLATPFLLFQSHIPVFKNHFPAGTSTKNSIHAVQLLYTDRLQQYNYGLAGNIKQYNSSQPPKYDISKVNVPSRLYHRPNDIIVDPVDVKNFYPQLPQPMGLIRINDDKFMHLDFLNNRDQNQLFNDELISFLNRVTDPRTGSEFIQEMVQTAIRNRSETRSG